MKLIHISLGGPNRKISVGGKVYDFEMHPYCGPMPIGKRGNPVQYAPAAFWDAVTLWAQQDQRIEGDLCRWDHEPEPITKHLGGRHYKLIGFREPKRGE